MKRSYLFTVALILFVATTVSAQFGIQAGASFGTMKTELQEDDQTQTVKLDNRTSVTGGVFYRLPILSAFALQPELNFLQKGGQSKVEAPGINITSTTAINYLELPVYFMYTGGSNTGFFVGVGPSFNMGISGQRKVESNGSSTENDIEFGNDGDYKAFHVSINGVAGYQLANGLGLNSFVSQSVVNSGPDNVFDPKVNFFNYGIRLSYMFSIKKSAK